MRIDEWVKAEEEWARIHRRQKKRDLFSLHDSQGGPRFRGKSRKRRESTMQTDGGERRIVARCKEKETSQDLPENRRSSRFRKSWEVLSDQKEATSRVTSRGMCWVTSWTFDPHHSNAKKKNLSDTKDQRDILWLVSEKRPKLVFGSGMCMLFWTVLYHLQIKRRAWFLHDLGGDASQLSLPCMIRMVCMISSTRSVAQDRGDTESKIKLPRTQSTHSQTGGRIEKIERERESQICQGVRQQVTDESRTSTMMHLASGNTGQPRRPHSPDTHAALSEE